MVPSSEYITSKLATSMSESLYKRIGGGSAVASTVVKLYDKILKDELLIPFFENVDVETLRRSQVSFVSLAFGGLVQYSGQDLRNAHASLVPKGLDDVHFDRVAHHLKSSMAELGVAADLIAEAMLIVETTRADVLNRPIP